MPDPIPPTSKNDTPAVKFGPSAWALVVGLTLIGFFVFHIGFYPAAVGSLVVVYLFIQGNHELKAQRSGTQTKPGEPSDASAQPSPQLPFEFANAMPTSQLAATLTVNPNTADAPTSAAAPGGPKATGNPAISVLKGCVILAGVGVGLIVISIGGLAVWYSLQPKDVSYTDVLTHDNDRTFQEHHSWSDSLTEKGNTNAAEQAIARLGPAAYGKTFGDLMDIEKDAERKSAEVAEKRSWEQSCRPGDVREGDNSDRVFCSKRYPKQEAIKIYEGCWGRVQTALDKVVADQSAAHQYLRNQDAESALQAEENAKAFATSGKETVENTSNCPEAFKDALSAASDYFDDELFYVSETEDAIHGNQDAANQLSRLGNDLDESMLVISGHLLVDKASIGIPLQN